MPLDLPQKTRSLTFADRTLSFKNMHQIGEQHSLVSLHFTNCPLTDEHMAPLSGLTRMLNFGVENALITDQCLSFLTAMHKLKILLLAGNVGISGQGLICLRDLPLDCIDLSHSGLDDAGLAVVASLPKLKSIRVEGTRLSLDGLMAISWNKRLTIYAGSQFSAREMDAFQAAQLAHAKKKISINQNDAQEAKEILLAFFAAMIPWERAAVESLFGDDETTSLRLERECREIFTRFVTTKERPGFRPDSLSVQSPPRYASHVIKDMEQPSKNKIFIYTQDRFAEQTRFVLIRRENQWKIDEAYHKDGNWKKYGL